ncbi:MAG: response regulator transcription factor, partial [Chitinophagaceae bacterium]|jgi:DNA-binding NarL/FixJ family response regulator|nr:response regulator transcription factor [Chitinophagaceae bacterium]
MSITIAIVDDNKDVRRFLLEQMNFSEEISVVFTAKNGKDFLEQMKNLPAENQPSIVLMDIEMPEMNGIEAVSIGSRLYPDVKFLMLTVFDDDDKIFEAIQSGASGYLLKDEKTSKIIDYIVQMQEQGGAPMSPSIARKALQLLSKSSFENAKPDDKTPTIYAALSDREKDVLKLLVEGKDYKAIAGILFLSTHTIRKHIANIYQKLHINSKAQAINVAHKQKWFE